MTAPDGRGRPERPAPGSPATGASRTLIGIPGEDSSTGAVLVGLPIGGGSVGYLKGTEVGNRYGFAVAP